MDSLLFKLNSNDFVKGAFVAMFGAVVKVLYLAATTDSLLTALTDWKSLLNAAVTAGLAYLTTKFITDENGKIAGRFGGRK